jgi:hypothetical protein
VSPKFGDAPQLLGSTITREIIDLPAAPDGEQWDPTVDVAPNIGQAYVSSATSSSWVEPHLQYHVYVHQTTKELWEMTKNAEGKLEPTMPLSDAAADNAVKAATVHIGPTRRPC